MSFQLRAIGFSRLVCHLGDAELDYIRTLMLLTGQSQKVKMRADTFKSDHGITSYLDLGNGQWLEGSCDPDSDEILKLNVHQVVPIMWHFNITTDIPF